MTPEIDAIFLDLGNTLRILLKDETHQARARREVARLVGTTEDPDAFCAEIDRRYKVYRKWATAEWIEAPEAELWTRWLLPEYPREQIEPVATELTFQYRQSMGRRVVQEDGRRVVEELDRRGYILGIISNVITSREIPDWMEADGFTPYFKSVVLSSVCGRRKPDPAIYHEAARRAGVAPERCAYVGDNFARDVEGTRNAGFGMVIIMPDEEDRDVTPPEAQRPDRIIHSLTELLTIFPDRHPAHGATALAEAVCAAYAAGQTDYSLEPLVAVDGTGAPIGRIEDGDAVVFCCRRGEREIQLTEAFTEPGFSRFARRELHDLTFVILTLYHEKFHSLPVAFAPSQIGDTLGEVVSRAGLRQLRVAESEKYAHVTFFLNGGNSQPFAGESDARIPSPTGVAYEQVPELSLADVAETVTRGIGEGYDLIVTNFANGDVIGHTASRAAKLACAEVVSRRLGEVVEAALAADYAVLITADHGNLEEMTLPDDGPHVSHTTNPVSFIALDGRSAAPVRAVDGRLADVAPTVLHALGLPAPAAMEGRSLTPDHAWGGSRPVLLVILDGWGLGPRGEDDPIHLASTPAWDALLARGGWSHLAASAEAVGLQAGKAGNSEAGHMNIGAGRVVPQDDVRLDAAMQDGSFATNPVLLNALLDVQRRGRRLHLIGLLTERSSHGSIDYPLALLRMAADHGLADVCLHLIFDGRSTEPGSAPALLADLERRMAGIGAGKVVSGVGRGIALDRNGNYAKTRRAYEAMVDGAGTPYHWRAPAAAPARIG